MFDLSAFTTANPFLVDANGTTQPVLSTPPAATVDTSNWPNPYAPGSGIPAPQFPIRPGVGTASAGTTNPAPTVASPDQIITGAAGTIAGGVSQMATGAVAKAAGSIFSQQYVVIIIGLMLIGAGLLMFHQIREPIIEAGKGAALAAA